MEFVKLCGSLALGAILIWVIGMSGDPIINDAGNATPGGGPGAEMNGYLNDYTALMPALFIVVSFFGFVVKAVYERGSV